MAISTCKITYWCILFWGLVCVRVCGRESACSVPWHCFCTSLVLAYLFIILFPFSHTCFLPSLPPLPELQGCGRSNNTWFRAGWSIISVLFAASFSCLMPCAHSVVKVWGLGVKLRRKKLLSALQDQSMTMKRVCMYVHADTVCAVYALTQQARLLHKCNKHPPLGHSIHLLF